MEYPTSIKNLIEHFSKLPTVGPKTAERYVFYLLKQSTENLQKFSQTLSGLKEKISVCQVCLAYAETNPCPICADGKRDRSLLCVIADYRDMAAIEATRQYNGLYYILGGNLNTIEGIGPGDLNISGLMEKIKKNNIKEIILALNPNLEGETTAMYLTKLLKPYKLRVTRLAKGLPMGADLEYADEMTLANALKYRNEI